MESNIDENLAPGVQQYLRAVTPEQKQRDCLQLMDLMREVTGLEPVLWNKGIVGFGRYHYRYESGREGDWFLVGFAARSQNLAIYIMPGFNGYDPLLQRLGKYKTGTSCLYLQRLEDVDTQVLGELVRLSVQHMQSKQ
jgi:hypothetical protein